MQDAQGRGYKRHYEELLRKRDLTIFFALFDQWSGNVNIDVVSQCALNET